MAKFKSRWQSLSVNFLDDDDEITETVELHPRDADIIATERQMGEGISKLDERGTAEVPVRIAWNALTRQGRAVGDFDEFSARADVERLIDPPVLPDGLPDPNPSDGTPPSDSESPSDS